MTATRKRQRPAPAPSAPKPREPVEGGYRCAECGHGEKLWAWAGCNAYGPLAADGRELAEHEDVIEWGIHEDSIQCWEHPGAVIERLVEGRWCRWWWCARCKGRRWITYSGDVSGRGFTCPAESPFWEHEGWIPVKEHQAAAGG